MDKLSLLLLSILVLQITTRASLPDLTTSAFQNQCLSRTNAIRGLHKNTPNMTTDPNLVSYAKSRCATISQGYILSVGHSGLANGYGENIYWGYSHRKIIPNCNSAVNGWNSESPNYNYAHLGFSSTTSHFTQLVWTSTTREGCAVCGGQGQYFEYYIVCVYQPPGNVFGQFANNVHPFA